MNYFYDTFPTPAGAFSVAVNEAGAIRATAFGDMHALTRRLGAFCVIHEKGAVRTAREQVLAYFAGERRTFDAPLAECGTEFQRRVWTELRDIPWGETRTYGEIAASIGQPAASRAVGRANATNPICLIVPCHRVVGSDGSLTGFAFGERIKRLLLEHEGALPFTPPRTNAGRQLATKR